jgi:hypothetical protein
MRRWFIIFMLFLLPIRGLVGDAMAYSMLPAGGEVAHETAVQNESKAPCHMDMAATDDAGTQQSQCTTCQACNLSAAIPLLLPEGILHTTAAAPTQRTAHWISAEPRLLAKTPVL